MHKVIFDTDPGVDDAMALLFLHQHPDIDLVGVTSVFGNAAIETTTRNALFLKREWEIPAPVARGANETIDPHRPHAPWPTFIHGDDGLGNINVPDDIGLSADPRPAHRFIIDMVRAHPGEITLVAVGRMTNLANALGEAPEIAGLVKSVVIMGGAFDVPGNVTPAAEANIHGDPEAADRVFTAPWPVVVIGLDVTMQTVMTRSQLADIAKAGGKRTQLLSDLSQFYIDFYEGLVDDGMVVHDSLRLRLCRRARTLHPQKRCDARRLRRYRRWPDHPEAGRPQVPAEPLGQPAQPAGRHRHRRQGRARPDPQDAGQRGLRRIRTEAFEQVAINVQPSLPSWSGLTRPSTRRPPSAR